MNIQNKFKKANVIYKITKDYDLEGTTLIIPVGCTLDFLGGSFANGTIQGSNTRITSGLIKIFDNTTITGTWDIIESYPEWFGAKGDGVTDDTAALQRAIQLATVSINKSVELMRATYNITQPITISSNIRIGNKYSKEVDNYILPRINVVGDIDGIILSQGTTERIENITIEGIGIYGDTITGNGIAFYGDTTKISGVYYCTFKSVFVTGFSNGMYFKTNGFAGFAYSRIDRCQFRNNTIGFQLEGIEFDGKKCWFNANEFNLCTIGNNRIGGIFINGIEYTNSVTINGGSIEANGKNYSDAEYEIYNCGFGIKMISKGIGNLNVRNCYIEANYPSRVVEGTTQYPANISTDCATFIMNGGGIKVQNCFIQSYGLVGILSNLFQGTFISNTWGSVVADANNNNCLFILDISHSYINDFGKFIFKEDNEMSYSLTTSNLYKLIGSNTNSLSNFIVDIDSSKYGIFRHRNGEVITNNIYISDTGTSYGFGFTANDPLSSLDSVIELLYGSKIRTAGSNKLNIIIVDSATYNSSQTGRSLNIPCIIKGSTQASVLLINSPIPISDNLIISGCTLRLGSNASCFIEFSDNLLNCYINWSIIKFNNNSQVLFGNTKNFKHCSCSLVNQTCFGSDNGNNNKVFDFTEESIMVTLDSITFDSNYNLVTKKLNTDNNYIVASNTTANRPSTPLTGQVFIDTTLNKMIWYDGSTWKDATGTTV